MSYLYSKSLRRISIKYFSASISIIVVSLFIVLSPSKPDYSGDPDPGDIYACTVMSWTHSCAITYIRS